MRRRTLNIVFGLAAVSPLALLAAPTAGRADSELEAALAPRFLGAETAPATLIEYFSMTCPACASFHRKTYPQIREKYIDTGLLRFELRDYPLDLWGLRAAAMARCAPASRYFALVDLLMKQQARWTRADDILGALQTIGRLAGLNPRRVEACMTDKALLDGILERRLEGERTYAIRSTPSFVLNGQVIRGLLSFEEFDGLLAAATESG